MMIKKFGALLLSAVLCIGIAVPTFAFEGDTAPVRMLSPLQMKPLVP